MERFHWQPSCLLFGPLTWTQQGNSDHGRFRGLSVLCTWSRVAFPYYALDQGWKIGIEAPLWNIIHIPHFYCTRKYSGLLLSKEDTKFSLPLTYKGSEFVTVKLSLVPSHGKSSSVPPPPPQLSSHPAGNQKVVRYPLTPSGSSYSPEGLSALAQPL